jgi:hypothetical protein
MVGRVRSPYAHLPDIARSQRHGYTLQRLEPAEPVGPARMKRRSSRRAFCRRSNSTNRQSASFLSEPIFCPELRCIPIQDNPGRAVRAILPQHDSRSSRPAPDTGDRGKRVIPNLLPCGRNVPDLCTGRASVRPGRGGDRAGRSWVLAYPSADGRWLHGCTWAGRPDRFLTQGGPHEDHRDRHPGGLHQRDRFRPSGLR